MLARSVRLQPVASPGHEGGNVLNMRVVATQRPVVPVSALPLLPC